MAHSTPVQTATAASTAAADARSHATGSYQRHHATAGSPPKTVANAILKRHVEQRQRFDSADYALIQSAAATAKAKHQQQQQECIDSSSNASTTAEEQDEPEPEASRTELAAPPSPSRLAIDTLSLSQSVSTGSTGGYPQQNVRRIRLQRFDSADWVMDANTKAAARSPRSSDCLDPSTQSAAAVAKLILDRHAYTTCHFVTTPVDKRQRCAEKA